MGGVCTDISGFWNSNIECSEYAKWTEDDRSKARVDMVIKIDKVLKDAKVNYVSKLIGKPVEVIFENNTIKSWRILTEVL